MPTINPATIMFLAKPPPHCHIHVPFEHFQGCEVISSRLPVEQALGVSAGACSSQHWGLPGPVSAVQGQCGYGSIVLLC